MATVEFLKKRVDGKQNELDKLLKKMDRIEAAEKTGWVKNPYYYGQRDKERTAREIERTRKALAGYEAQLQAATEKAASRDVKAILDFLEMWKSKMRKYYHREFENYTVAIEQYYSDDNDLRDAEEKLSWGDHREERKEIAAKRRELSKMFQERWHFIERYVDRKYIPLETDDPFYPKYKREYVFLDDVFEKDLAQEADAKYDNIIERTNEICGKIVDAKGLKVGQKGELDGIVMGERGNARVHTIGAGGYNIQCFHFRVLVHEAKGVA